ncbi:Monomeric sarcosine oxidase [Thalassoglobus neptunius]|uniref:Monomeric sarcosine oxidase n=2 Tax=Thalassoglobus neptunius TaxID=1938619 RepID=A0A5C5X308_9PLAN|nr:Monomeric sarcosine oxidase [Thalassoglobus neptunius]
MTEQQFDLIVIGGGGVGSSTAYFAALRKLNVLVLEQFPRGHEQGSSHGETRVIRTAYHEHPDYVPLAQNAYKLWQRIEDRFERALLSPCGLMLAGPPDAETIHGARTASDLHGIELEDVPAQEFQERFPGFNLPEGYEVVYEPNAGFLDVEECVETFFELAQLKGAQFAWDSPVTHWESDGESVTVFVGEKTFHARNLVIASGAWSNQLLNETPGFPSLEVLRKFMVWFPVRADSYDLSLGSSIFHYTMPYGEFYGFPSLDGETVKVCEHSGGRTVSPPFKEAPEMMDSDLEPLERFLTDVMPDLEPQSESYSPCLYTLTSDRHFIVDEHPQHQNVHFAAGLSGHGFKFVNVIGKALADLVIDRETEQPISFLSLKRFTNPGF